MPAHPPLVPVADLKRCFVSEQMFKQLTPVLPVADVPVELAFYERLGFRRHVDPAEVHPVGKFAAVAYGEHILFGLARAETETVLPPRGLSWQFETTDLDSVSDAAATAGMQVKQPVTRQPWGRRTTLSSPRCGSARGG